MKNMYCSIAIATLAAFTAAADEIVCASEAVTYRLDTRPSPRAIRTQAELDALWEATYSSGETVTVEDPSGAAATLVSGASESGEAAMTFNAGGLWTVVNSAEGKATFTVRHSIFGTLGAGTSASPAKIVDETEILDLANAGIAGAGYAVAFAGADGLEDGVLVPPQYALESAGEGLWRLAQASGVGMVVSESDVYLLDTMQGGPDRTIRRRHGHSIAYSGDDWEGAASAASSLTVVAPSGVSSTQNLEGTGAVPFAPDGKGDTVVTLNAGGTVLSAVITYAPPPGFIISVR